MPYESRLDDPPVNKKVKCYVLYAELIDALRIMCLKRHHCVSRSN